MTVAEARTLAQSDPVETLTARYGQVCREAKVQRDYFTTTLRHLDEIAAKLAEHDVTVSVDLGPIGNAAAAARRDLEKRSDRPTFEMPR